MRTVLVALAAALSWVPALAQDVVGTATALQADQIVIGSGRISLYGIDAPDPDQDRECTLEGRLFGCYSNAKRALEILVDRGPVTCAPTGDTNYVGFPYSICTTNDEDIGRELVRQGWALAFRPQSDMYVEDEEAARAAGLGLWQEGVGFAIPWENRTEYGGPLYGP